MRAAEHERIDPFPHECFQITRKDLIGDCILQPAFFDQRDEQRASANGDVNLRVQRSQSPLIRAAADRRAGPDHADVTIASSGNGGARTGQDDAGHRDPESFLQLRQCQGRSSVASHHDRFCIFREENVRDLETVTFDRARTLSAIGNSRRVAQVKNLLVRQKSAQFTHDGEPPNTRVENADRLRRLRAGFIRRH